MPGRSSLHDADLGGFCIFRRSAFAHAPRFSARSAENAETQLLRRAVFLDRDGTICEEMGYINHVDRLRIFPYAAAAIRQLNEAKFLSL